MVTAMCIAAENRSNDLAQSYSMHQACSGMAMGDEGPEPCECFHHGMPATPRRRMRLRAKARLVLAAALVLLLLWAVLR